VESTSLKVLSHHTDTRGYRSAETHHIFVG